MNSAIPEHTPSRHRLCPATTNQWNSPDTRRDYFRRRGRRTPEFREPGGAAATALQSVQSSLNESQDFARAAWMLVHMAMFQPDYRTKFGDLLRALAAGSESGAAFGKVYDAPISKLHTALVTYSRQTGIMVMTAPFKVERQPPPKVKSVEKEEQDRILADLK